MKQILALWILILPLISIGQSITGTWEYQVLNTLSGDYFGQLIIEKQDDGYVGEIISTGENYNVDFNYIDKDSISISSNVEEFFATIKGKFKGNIFVGKVTVLGDSNIYVFSAQRKSKEQIFKVVDAESNEIISYANILHGSEGAITNEDGLFKINIESHASKIIVSAIGYKTDTIHKMDSESDIKIIKLNPINYSLPLIEVKAKGFSAKKIVEAAILRISENYIQQPYNANLFYRFSRFNDKDSLVYQSESLLNFFDSKGYQKRGWRNAAGSRYAKLKQGRISIGKQKDNLKLDELGQIFFFWAHEPIVTNDKPISKSSLNAYDYKLVGIKNFMGKDVFEIEFTCTKLKYRYTGLPSQKYMNGKLFINKEDYAIIRYEHKYLQDYTYKGKHTKKRGNLKERTIIESSRIELFAKNKDKYYLDYSRIINNNERQNTLLDGAIKIHKDKFITEYQYFDLTTKDVEPLSENLLKLNNQTQYNEEYWEQFNIILKEN